MLDLSHLPSLDALKESVLRDEWKADPRRWLKERLGETMWSKQLEVMKSVVSNRRTAVQSAHSTGKSWVAARLAAFHLDVHAPGEAFVVTSAPTGSQVKAILWREISRAFAKGNFDGRVNQTEWWMRMPDGHEEIVAFGRKPGDLAPDAFQGIHQRYVLVIFDEACGIHSALWDPADSLISNVHSRFLAIGNPDDPVSTFADVCAPGSGWNTIKISAFDTPNFTGEEVAPYTRDLLVSRLWVEEKAKSWGVNSPSYISKVLGEFPESTIDGLIPVSWIRAAQERHLEPGMPIELGVDVGGGGDRSTIYVRRGAVCRQLKSVQQPDTMKLTGEVIHAIKSTGASIAKIDEIGIGRGVVDRCLEQKYPVLGVNVGTSSMRDYDGEHFADLRSQALWELRVRFEEGTIDIDAADEDLEAQLRELRYARTSAGKIKIESKRDMARRGVHSPDEADAAMLSFMQPYVAPMVPATWGRKIG